MKLPIYYDWEPSPLARATTTFSSANVRLDDHVGWTLKENFSTKLYPTGGEHYVVLRAFAPSALRRWLSLDATVYEPKDSTGTTVGTVRFRLKAGSSTYWWSGAAWATPSSGNWNTLAEIQANLSTFPTTSKSLALVARLQTSDSAKAPILRGAGVAAEVVVKGQHYELIYRGLLRRLKTIRPIVDLAVEWAATGTTHSLSGLVQEESVSISEVVELYNFDSDPDQATDVFSSWNSGTQTITATSSIAAGTTVILRARIVPTVAYTTAPDYKVPARIPSLQISDLNSVMSSQVPGGRAFVSRADGSAIVVRNPRQLDLTLRLSGVASRPEEAFSLVESSLNSIRENRLLSLGELDETVDVTVQGEITMVPSFDEVNTHRAEVLLLLRNFNRWHESLGTGHGVQVVNVTGDLDATLEG